MPDFLVSFFTQLICRLSYIRIFDLQKRTFPKLDFDGWKPLLCLKKAWSLLIMRKDTRSKKCRSHLLQSGQIAQLVPCWKILSIWLIILEYFSFHLLFFVPIWSGSEFVIVFAVAKTFTFSFFGFFISRLPLRLFPFDIFLLSYCLNWMLRDSFGRHSKLGYL